MHKHLIFWSVSLLAAGAGCAGSQAEQVRDARSEQADAQADAREESAERRGDAREDSIDRTANANEDTIAAADGPAEGANKDLAEVSKDRSVYQSEAQTRVDKLGARLDAATQKLNVLGGRAPTPLKTELATTWQQYKMLKEDVQGLNTTAPTEWEARTSKIDDRIALLDDRIKELTDSIEGV